MWKDFFYFSKRERQAILIIIVFIAGVFLGKFLFTPAPLPPVEKLGIQNKPEEKRSENKERSTTPTYSESKQKPYQPYRKQQNNQPEKRTYYQQSEKPEQTPKQNQYPVSEKLAEGTIIEINASDTTQLKRIPGIGSSFAKRIVGYRTILGGYYRIEQLQEVYGMYEELYEKIIPYLEVNADSIKTIPVNTASIDKLKAHPYLNFYQAKAIVELRKKKGELKSIDELILLEEFTADDLERIKHYLIFSANVNVGL